MRSGPSLILTSQVGEGLGMSVVERTVAGLLDVKESQVAPHHLHTCVCRHAHMLTTAGSH